MTLKNLLILGLFFGIISCSPKLNNDWTKENYEARNYGKIAVVGISDNLDARNEFDKNNQG